MNAGDFGLTRILNYVEKQLMLFKDRSERRERMSYRQVIHDGPRPMEHQMYLLADAAHRIWDRWCKRDEAGERGIYKEGKDREDFDTDMAYLCRTLLETDIFMSGYQVGKEENNANL